MEQFLKSPYGVAAFIAFDFIALLLIVCITYRWFFKRFLDFLAAAVAIVFTSPVLFIAYLSAIYAKKQGKIEKILQKQSFVSKKGKPVCLHTLAIGKVGKIFLLFEVFFGKISFVGTLLFRAQDIAFLEEEEKDRLAVRAGLIHPLVVCGNEKTDYDEAIQVEMQYAKKYSFFGDCKIFFSWLIKKIRGESNEYLGETRNEGYIEALKREERISQADFDAAIEALAK